MPANSGVTGLIDMPTARLMPDWNLRAYYTWADPYKTFGMSATPLPWFEINGRLTEVYGLLYTPSYGDYKDKALDIKIKLLNENKSQPALAIGATDVHGTGLFTSRFICANKFYGPFDITLGAGQGILAGEFVGGTGSSGSASQDAAVEFLTSGASKTRLFGGTELLITDKLSFLAEYSSLDYERLFGVTEASSPGDTPLNFGVRYHPWEGSVASLSYLRGKFWGWSLSTNFPLGPEGILPWKKQPYRILGEDLFQQAQEASNPELALIIREEVAAEGFSNVRVSVSDRSVWLEIENPTYLSETKALGRACRVAAAIVPERIQWLYISSKSRDLILTTIKMGRKDFEAFLVGRLDEQGLLEFIEFHNDGKEELAAFLKEEPVPSPITAPGGTKRYRLGAKPSLQTLFNDPSGFLKSSFSMLWQASYFPWPGGLIRGSVRTPFYNNISTAVEVDESNPTRTDFVNYKGRSDVHLETLAFDQVFDLPDNWLGRAEVGLFEAAYGGVGAELFRFYHNGRWGLGMESEVVKKRDFENDLEFKDSTIYKTLFLNVYHKLIPTYGVDAGIKIGRFLGGDWGGRLDLSRTYKYFTMGAWYTATNSADVFQSAYNKGYNDKGVYFIIPFSIFTDRDTPSRLTYSISPWTKDPGQIVNQITSLYPLAERANIDALERNLNDMKE